MKDAAPFVLDGFYSRNTATGIIIINVCDSFITNVHYCALGVTLFGCAGFTINNCYLDAGTDINPALNLTAVSASIVSNLWLDTVHTDDLWLGHVDTCQFSNIFCHKNGGENNTYSGISMQNASAYGYGGLWPCHDNCFANIDFYANYGTAYLWQYGIQKTDSSQDGNVGSSLTIYTQNAGSVIGTATVRHLGANSKYDADSIIGTIVTS